MLGLLVSSFGARQLLQARQRPRRPRSEDTRPRVSRVSSSLSTTSTHCASTFTGSDSTPGQRRLGLAQQVRIDGSQTTRPSRRDGARWSRGKDFQTGFWSTTHLLSFPRSPICRPDRESRSPRKPRGDHIEIPCRSVRMLFSGPLGIELVRGAWFEEGQQVEVLPDLEQLALTDLTHQHDRQLELRTRSWLVRRC
jgi:hypothetical protein